MTEFNYGVGSKIEFSLGIRGSDKDEWCQVHVIHPDRLARAQNFAWGLEQARAAAELLKVLSDPNRLRILSALAREELCVCDLAALLGVSHSNVSHQLRVLRQAGFVRYRREGKLAYYTCNLSALSRLLSLCCVGLGIGVEDITDIGSLNKVGNGGLNDE